MFSLVEMNKITVPLWKSGQSFPNNKVFVRDFTVNLLQKSFKNLTIAQNKEFVEGLFRLHNQAGFKVHLRDFFVKLKEFNKDGTDGFFLEEHEKRKADQKAAEDKRVAAVPGLHYEGPMKPRQ